MAEEAAGGTPVGDFGGLVTSIFGNKSSTQGSSTTNSEQSTEMERLFSELINTTNNTSLDSTEKSSILENLLSEINSTMQSTTSLLSEELLASATESFEVISNAMKQAITLDYSPEAAANLSQEARTSAINEVLKSGMSQVADFGSNSGAFDSSVQGNAATEIAALAAEKGAAAELGVQQTFASLAQQQAADLTSSTNNLLSVLKGATSSTTTDTGQSTQTNTTSATETDKDSNTITDSITSTDSTDTQESLAAATSKTDTKTKEKKGGILSNIFG